MIKFYKWQVTPGGDPPTRVLEEGRVVSEDATIEFAQNLLKEKWYGEPYRIQAGHWLKPGDVRIIDDKGAEVLKYTLLDLRRDGYMPRPGEEEADDETPGGSSG